VRAESRDGSRLVYDVHDGEKVTILQAEFQGGEPAKIWEENIGQGSFQWSPKGDEILYFHREPPGSVGLMNLVSKKRQVLLRHPKTNLSLADARLSPDGQWIAFPVPFAPHRSRLAVARVSERAIAAEEDWSYLTPETFNASQPEWAPNGRWLYFLSDQTKKLSVWAVALSDQKKPESEPRAILEFRRQQASARIGRAEFAGVLGIVDEGEFIRRRQINRGNIADAPVETRPRAHLRMRERGNLANGQPDA
jgi:tricorn protease-like protein